MKIIKLFTGILLSFLLINNTFALEENLSIIDIDSSNSNIVKLFFDKDIESNNDKITGDVKIFKDLTTKNITRDLENDKILNISLEIDLEKNKSYSLLSVYGVDGNIDFKIKDLINGLEISGNDSDGIEKLDIIDSKNLKIIFRDSLTSEEIDIKLLREYNLDSLKLNSSNKKELDIYLKDVLVEASKYLVMMFSFNTEENDIYNISNSIYDFETKSSLGNKVAKPLDNNIDTKNKTGNVALNSASTPDTGAETWILLLFTLLLSNFIYFRKKFLK